MLSCDSPAEPTHSLLRKDKPHMTPDDIKNTILEGKRYPGPMIGKGYMDSLGLLNLVLFLEDEFEIIVLNEDMTAENFDTLDSLVSYVQRQLGKD